MVDFCVHLINHFIDDCSIPFTVFVFLVIYFSCVVWHSCILCARHIKVALWDVLLSVFFEVFLYEWRVCVGMDDVIVSQFESFVESYGAGVAVSNSDAVVHVCETMGEFDELVEWINQASEEEYRGLVENRGE